MSVTSLKKSKPRNHSTHLSDHLELSSDLSAPVFFSASADFPAPNAREPHQLPFIYTMAKLSLWHGHACLMFLCATSENPKPRCLPWAQIHGSFSPSFLSPMSQALMSEFLPLFLPPFSSSFLLLLFILCKGRASGARRTSLHLAPLILSCVTLTYYQAFSASALSSVKGT